MQKIAAVLVTVSCLTVCLSAGNSSRHRERFDRTLSSISFEEVDLAPLQAVFQNHDLALSDEELAEFADKNLRYIFYQKLNKAKFLVAPEPERVVERIAEILNLNRKVSALIYEGRQLVSQPGLTGDKERLVRGVGKAARRLRKEFNSYFMEAHTSTYSFKLPRGGDTSQQFLAFILQSDQISRLLENRLNEYFFNRTPGSVSLTEYDSDSILTLVECLERLSEQVGKNLLVLK